MIQPVPVALLLGIALLVSWRTHRDHHLFATGLSWLAYAGYEVLMYTRVLCSGECNIRVDLLLIYPLLLGSTLWAVLAAVRSARRRRRTQGN